MRNWKKRGSLLLALLLLISSFPLGAMAVNFTDIKDSQTAQNVEVLQMMNIINGVSYNSFQPEGNLTRAQFTKMAVLALGLGEQAASYKSFTIFPDVKSSHWAAGYINLAVRGEKKFISGYANGTFGPEQVITYGQAVTILMRLLGYKDADVGMVWPTGYLNTATAIGLTKDVSLGAESAITRGKAAQLFVNLLGAKLKDGSKIFATSVATEVKENVVVLDAQAKTDEGKPAIEILGGTYPLANSHVPTLLQGKRGTLLLNAKGEAWGFLPSTVGTMKDIVVSSAKAGSITDMEGKEYTVNGNTTAVYKGKETTYGEIFINLRSGTRVTLHFDVGGKVEGVYVGTVSAENVIMIGKDGSTAGLSSLAGGRTDYAIYKNGESVNASAIKAYDVATYIPGENTIYISTLRLTGFYESAYPNASAPTEITLFGKKFPVLPGATASLSQFKVGDQVTFLFTQDFQVAGAVSGKTLRSTAVGIATVKDGMATVELLDGLTVTGTSSKNEYKGELVTVTSSSRGSLNLSPVNGSGVPGTLVVGERKLGTADLAANVRILERAGNSPVEEIALDDIRLTTVEQAKVKLARRNDAGKIDLLVLDNVTGDRYVYGIPFIEKVVSSYEKKQDGVDAQGNPNMVNDLDKPIYERAMRIENGKGKSDPFTPVSAPSGTWIGVATSKMKFQASDSLAISQVADFVVLTQVSNVTNNQWLDEETVQINQVPYEVSKQVGCYNRSSHQWISLGEARAFTGTMTLYVDEFHVVRGVEVG